jgi:hypothetical protein
MDSRWGWTLVGFIAGIAVVLAGAFAMYYAQRTDRQITLPAPQSPDAQSPVLIESRFTCQTNAITTADRAWMEACYVTGRLSQACQQSFYDDGSYLFPSKTTAQYEYDQELCACALPIALANDLNNQQVDSWNSCSDYPETARLFQ